MTRTQLRHSRTHPRRLFFLGGGLLFLGACTPGRSISGVDDHAPGARREHVSAEQQQRPARPAQAPPRANRLRPEAGQSAHQQHARSSVRHTLSATTGRQIALTFDDGPDPRYTPQVLQVLRRYNVQATFCVLGENAVDQPKLLHSIVEDGHEIANHSWSHPQLTKLKHTDMYGQLARTSDLISRTVGAPPTLARAPYGAWDHTSRAVSARLGMSPLGWSVDTEDWKLPGVATVSKTVLQHVQPASIILSHDGGGDRSQTASALEYYLPRLLDDGYTPVLPT